MMSALLYWYSNSTEIKLIPVGRPVRPCDICSAVHFWGITPKTEGIQNLTTNDEDRTVSVLHNVFLVRRRQLPYKSSLDSNRVGHSEQTEEIDREGLFKH